MDNIENANKNDQDLHIVVADLSAAFDKIGRKYIMQVMKQLNFPDTFLTMLQRTLNNNQVQINVIGKPTKLIRQEEGLGQGDPLSAVTF